MHACCVLVSVGSPNCPIIQNIFTRVDSLAVSIQQSHKTWLTVCYNVEVTSTNMSIVTMHNSTITSDGFVEVKSLQPGTDYNISVTPCNMVGCNKSCDMYSVQTAVVPTGGGEYGMQNHGAVMIIDDNSTQRDNENTSCSYPSPTCICYC